MWDWEGDSPSQVLLRLLTKTYASQLALIDTAEVIEARFWCYRVGVGSGTVTAKVWADSANAPGDLIATSAGLDSSLFSETPGWVTWTFAGVTMTAGTKYWVGLQSTGGSTGYYIAAERRTGPAETWYVLRYGEAPPPWNASSKSARLTTQLRGYVA